MAQLGLDGAGRAEPALGVDVHIARAGTQGAVVAHAHAGFGANEGDLAGVHAAELAHVQRKGRGAAGRRGGAGLHLVLVGVDGVVARHHLQVVGVDLGVELDGARQDAGVIGEAGVKPRAVDADGAALHAVSLQAAAVDLRCAGGECGAAGVDEARAVHVDARRVGDDDLGARARHFDIAPELAGVGAVDFVDDDARLTARQPRVALHPATELGLHVLAAVVEHRPLGVHVELLVGVARHTGGTRGLDVDQRRAVGRQQHRGLLRGGRAGVGNDLRLHQRARQGGQRHAQRSPCAQRAACAPGQSRPGPFATAHRAFGHRHDAAARGVEDKSEGVAVHGVVVPVVFGVDIRSSRSG